VHIEDQKLDFTDVLIKPKRSTLASRRNVVLERTFKTRHGREITGVPIIAANMSTGNFRMATALAKHNMFTAIAKHHNEDWLNISKEDLKNIYLKYCFYTIGMCSDEEQKLHEFNNHLSRISPLKGPQLEDSLMICVDIANGYSQKFADYIRTIRSRYENRIIMVGNVCTPEMTQELILAGADIVKIGIGPGSVCTTRKMTGVGYPQISAAIENADVAHGLNALVCLDGGMRVPGDIAKAFCANADFVMLGGMFAGTDECDGDIITQYEHDGTYKVSKFTKEPFNDEKSIPGNSFVAVPTEFEPNIVEKKYKKWYGMSSDLSQAEHFGGIKDYRASEGLIEEVPYKGKVEIQVRNILGGLRSACTYIGAAELKNMGKCGSFIRVSRQHDRF